MASRYISRDEKRKWEKLREFIGDRHFKVRDLFYEKKFTGIFKYIVDDYKPRKERLFFINGCMFKITAECERDWKDVLDLDIAQIDIKNITIHIPEVSLEEKERLSQRVFAFFSICDTDETPYFYMVD